MVSVSDPDRGGPLRREDVSHPYSALQALRTANART